MPTQQDPIVTCPVQVVPSYTAGTASSGELRLRVLTTADRAKGALKSLGLCWAFAFLAVFIPILHFILVPLLVLTGPLLAYRGYRPKRLVLGGQATCPKCSTGFEVSPCIERWPLRQVCTSCHTLLVLEALPPT